MDNLLKREGWQDGKHCEINANNSFTKDLILLIFIPVLSNVYLLSN